MKNRYRRAFVMVDVSIALAILASMIMVLASVVSSQDKADQRLAGSRAVVELAADTMHALNEGRTAIVAPPDGRIFIEPAPGGQAITGYTWMRVTARLNGQTATLVGLARQRTVKAK